MAKEKTQYRNWKVYEEAVSLRKISELFKPDISLLENLIALNTFIMQQLLHLCNRSNAIHFFFNPKNNELHFIFFNRNKKLDANNNKYEKRIRINWLDGWLKDNESWHSYNDNGVPQITNLENGKFNKLLENLELNIFTKPKDILVLPFLHDQMNFGYFFIWNKPNKERNEENLKTLHARILNFNKTIVEIFKKEYKITPETYLPFYYKIGWKRVAIMFVDIRNFTQMTELLRNLSAKNKNKPGPLRQIVNDYCKRMSEVIGQYGRIDKFMGDGILAIFGEYDNHPSKIVNKAIYTACQILNEFENLKNEWENGILGEFFEIEYNETVDIELGIGINLGTVLFDYFGDEKHKEYSVIGDHVNFAQRLEGQASKFNEDTQKMNPPILISKTAYRCCHPWLKENETKELKISPKGKKHEYTVYGFESKAYKIKDLAKIIEENDWEKYWSNDISPMKFVHDESNTDFKI